MIITVFDGICLYGVPKEYQNLRIPDNVPHDTIDIKINNLPEEKKLRLSLMYEIVKMPDGSLDKFYGNYLSDRSYSMTQSQVEALTIERVQTKDQIADFINYNSREANRHASIVQELSNRNGYPDFKTLQNSREFRNYWFCQDRVTAGVNKMLWMDSRR